MTFRTIDHEDHDEDAKNYQEVMGRRARKGGGGDRFNDNTSSLICSSFFLPPSAFLNTFLFIPSSSRVDQLKEPSPMSFNQSSLFAGAQVCLL